MNVTLRSRLLKYFLVAVVFVFGLGFFESVQAQLTTYKAFWEALDSGTTPISLGSLKGAPMVDDDGMQIDFILDNSIANSISITGTTLIDYNGKAYDPDSDDDFYIFRIDIVGGSLSISSATTKVTNNYSDAGIFYVEDGTLSMKGATFQDNYSDDSGGAIYAITGSDATTVKIDGALTLENNTSLGDGGGFALFNTGTGLNVTGAAKINKNRAYGGGGAVYGQGAVITFGSTLTASENKAAGDGGVFNLDTNASLTVSGAATFTKNDAEYGDDSSATGGGVIYANMSSATFNGEAIFGFKGTVDKTLRNTAKTAGGAIYAEGGSTFTFKQSASFGGNTATVGNGGAVYLDSSHMTFSQGATFASNEAKAVDSGGDGGAIYVSTGTLDFSGTVKFSDNIATGGYYGGGAIYADLESVVTFATGSIVTFSGNKTVAGTGETLPSGGALYLSGLGAPSNDPVTYGWIMGGTTTFSNNEAAGKGGAIFTESSALQFSTVTFSGNKSGFTNTEDGDGGGGAIYADMDSLLHFEQKATFQNNTATTGSGGAIFVTGSGTTDPENPVPGLHFKNGAEFSGNKAVKGGALYLADSAVTFGGSSTLSGNEATGGGGAFYIQGDSLLHFEAGSSTTISGNKSTSKGGAVFVAEDSTLNLNVGGTGSASASVTFDAGSAAAANDIYLSSGSSLNAKVETGSTLTINSALSGVDRIDGETLLNVTGAGTVTIGGDTSGFKGDISIGEGSTLVLNPGSKSIGDADNSSLSISGGTLVVMIDQDSDPSAPARIQVKELEIDSEYGFCFDVQGFVTDADDVDNGFALITINDSNGKEILNEYLENGLISWMGSSDFTANILPKEEESDTWTLYVYVVFNPDTNDWEFTIGSGTKELAVKLDNTDPEHPENASKGLTVNGNGTLKLTVEGNKVSALLGNGHLELDYSLVVNGQGVSATDPQIFSGSLLGSGNFIKQGDFEQQLLGSNAEYKGNFDVQKGTLLGNTESLRNIITVADGATLVFDQSTLVDLEADPDRTFEGTLKGEGDVQVLGVNSIKDSDISDSVLRFKGDQTGFKGDMFVDRGWMLVESTGNLSGAREINVAANGGLGGSGRVGDVLINNGGAIQAYEGTLTVDGDLTVEKGGIVYVVLNSGSNAPSIAVTGDANIEDGARFEIAGIDADYKAGETFVFLSAEDIYLFGDIESSEYKDEDGKIWVFDFEIDEDGNLIGSGTIKDDPGPDPPKPVVKGLSQNQAQVAVALATIKPLDTTPAEMKTFINKLDEFKETDSDGNVKYDERYLAATKQLAGTIRAEGLQLGLFSPYRTVFNRLSLGSDLYGGSPTIYNNGYGPISGMESHGAGAGPSTYRGQLDPLNPHYEDGYGGCAPSCNIPCMMGENNFWADVTHVQTKTKGNSNSDEYGISRTGLLIGVDVQKQVNSRIGMVFGYFAPYLWQNSDRVEADDYHAGLYFQKKHHGVDLYGYIGYAHQEYRSRRFVDMSIIDADTYGRERYNGKTGGDSFNFSLEMSKPRYYSDCYVLRPLVAVDYYYTNQKGYTESDSGLFALQYDRAKYDQWFVRVGVNLKKETFRSTTVMRIQYINQFGENAYPDANARFVYTGSPTMNIQGVNLGRDYLNLGLGFNLFMNDARSKFVSFDYDFNTSRKTKSHALSLVLVERF